MRANILGALFGPAVAAFTLASTAQAQQPVDQAEAEPAQTDEEEKELLGDFWVDYSFANSVGGGSFQPRTSSVVHSLDVAVGYAITEHERVSVGIGASAEVFTRSRCAACGDDGASNGVFLGDMELSGSTSRLFIKDGDFRWSVTPTFRAMFPTSDSSRTVARFYVRSSLGASGAMTWRDLSVSVAPSIGYTFFENSHVVYENAESEAQNGGLLAPLSLRLGFGVKYTVLDAVTLSASYRFGKSKTYENNDGVSYWRDSATFGASASYSYKPWLGFSLAYTYLNDPLDGQGTVRNPFANTYADYSHLSALTFSVEGTIE